MIFNFFGKAWNKTSKHILLSAILLLAVTSLSALKALAQKGIVKFDYEYKSNAEGKLKVERERGRNARMYFNQKSRRWIVEVDYGNLTTIDDSSFENDSTDEDSNYATKPQTIIYHYEYKSNAEGKLKTERNRGKSARMFYDKTVGRWAVEVEEN